MMIDTPTHAVTDAGTASPADEPDTDLLRVSTAGSVDDGKSTLIGRLLHDARAIMEDQLDAVGDASRRRGAERIDLALLTDGLRDEREQGITIDVAYRSFQTPRRRFVLADTPGHVQYTRNMVTGASTADLAIVLVDARHGLVEQTRRHAHIAALLRVPHVVFAVNKMDLVDHDEPTFRRIEQDLRALADRIGVIDPIAIPISALHGDQVTSRSDALGWFDGPTLLEHLETVDPDPEAAAVGIGARMPVQWVIRPGGDRHHDFRGLAGRIAAGVLRPGDEVAILPDGGRSVIDRIERIGSDGEPEMLESAEAGRSVVVHLRDQVDVSRGDMICRLDDRPTVGDRFEARICWMGERPLRAGDRVLLKHGTRRASAIAESIVHALDLAEGAPLVGADRLEMNDLGRIRLRVATPIPHDAFERSRATGRFILIDEATDDTVAAGMILDDRDSDRDEPY